MGYKDKDKARQASKERMRRHRAKYKGVTQKIDVTPVTPPDVTPSVTPKDKLPTNYGLPDCQCKHCQQNRRKPNPLIINHGPYKLENELAPNEVNRVSLPGDMDYEGVGKW